ncbi:MAG TPA: hypothetical protein VNF72_10235 [Myxococcota bacterium]|nr:hypothetical protein [Myxococcota bacterium]
MRIYRTLLGITTVAGLWFGAGMTLADDTAAATDAGRRAKREAWCKENPEQCEAWKQKRAERQEFCKANPETCEQQRAERRERRAELQAKCAADPEKCDEMKQQMRARWKAHKAAGGTPKTPPPAE